MLLKMDERISAAIDAMIAKHKSGDGPKIFLGDTLDVDTLWIGEIYNLSNEFSCLADPDALEIIPRLMEVFDRKKSEVMKMDLPETLRDNILFKISSWRHQIGIDSRLHEINKRRGSSDSADVW